jgi:1-acyl-sn-glycerol-3-phosphate acyltransferase
LSAIRLYTKAFFGGFFIALFLPFLYMSEKKNKTRRTFLSNLLLKVFMVKPKITGQMENEAKILIINHQSVLDIVVMEAITSKNLCWIAKRELFNIPIFGHLFKSCKMIAVDRDSKQALIKLLKDSKEASDIGRPLVIFPEGTRGRGGELLEFKAGVKLIAEKLQLRVQPVVIVDSVHFLDTKYSSKEGGGSSKGGTMEIIYMDSFMPEGKEWLSDARARMQKVLDEARTRA